MVSRLIFDDYIGREITVIIFDPEDTDINYYDYCGGARPLVLKWHGERYTAIKGSEITIDLIIKNDADKAQIDQLLNGGFYTNVLIDGVKNWSGKIFPQFFVEPYKQYPYNLSINASDQLGQMKERQFLMIDFPEPFHIGSPEYNIIDVLNKALSEPDFYKTSISLPGAASGPKRMRVALRLFDNLENKLFETAYLDPLLFMDADKDRYKNKHETLNTILEPFNIRLFQWADYWYIVAFDSQYNGGDLTYSEYILDWINGPTYTETATVILPPIDMYTVPVNANTDNRQLRNDASLSYLPAWNILNITEKYEINTNILPIAANRTGSFYSGSEGVVLELEEFNPPYELLRNWTQHGYLPIWHVVKNDGMAVLHQSNIIGGYADRWETSQVFSTPGITGIILEWQAFNGEGNSDTEPIRFETEIVFYDEINTTYWLYLNNGVPEWSATQEFYHIELDIFQGLKTNVIIGLPNGKKLTTAYTKIKFGIVGVDTFGPTDAKLSFYGMRIRPRYEQWDEVEYKREVETVINPKGTIIKTEKEFMFPLNSATLSNYHDVHISGIYTNVGLIISELSKIGETGQKRVIDYLVNNYNVDNSEITAVLKASFRSRYLTPLTLIEDYEKRIYQFSNGTYEAKKAIWTGEYIEYKSYIKPPIGADFNIDFNNDFFIT